MRTNYLDSSWCPLNGHASTWVVRGRVCHSWFYWTAWHLVGCSPYVLSARHVNMKGSVSAQRNVRCSEARWCNQQESFFSSVQGCSGSDSSIWHSESIADHVTAVLARGRAMGSLHWELSVIALLGVLRRDHGSWFKWLIYQPLPRI